MPEQEKNHYIVCLIKWLAQHETLLTLFLTIFYLITDDKINVDVFWEKLKERTVVVHLYSKLMLFFEVSNKCQLYKYIFVHVL